MIVLVCSFASFEYLCYGSTTIINISLFLCRDGLHMPESGRPILMSKVDPRIEKVTI